jgi:hypothetical protein
MQRFAEAESVSRRALATIEKIHGPDQQKLAEGLTNLAVTLLETNQPAESESLIRRVAARPKPPRASPRLYNGVGAKGSG